MAGQLPPLNVIYWSGKDVGRRFGNPRFSMVIKEMVKYCCAVDFVNIFQCRGERSKPDVFVLSEIFPRNCYNDSDFYNLMQNKEGELCPGYKGRLVSLSEKSTPTDEHFLLAYSTETVGKVESKRISLEQDKKNALEIIVTLANSQGKLRNCPYKIVAFHIENEGKKNLMDAVGRWVNKRVHFSNSPHLLIGDTNLPVDRYPTTNNLNSEDGNAIKFHDGIKELDFENASQGFTVKTGSMSKSMIDRAWVSKQFVEARGYYLGYFQNQKQFSFPHNITRDLGHGRISDHPAMAIRLRLE